MPKDTIDKWVPPEPQKKQEAVVNESYTGESIARRAMKLCRDLSINAAGYGIQSTVDIYSDGTGSFYYSTPRMSVLYSAEMTGSVPDADMMIYFQITEADASEMKIFFTDPKKPEVRATIEVSSAKDGFEFSETTNPSTARSAINRSNEMLDGLEYIINNLKK